jgi:phosphoribosylformylglycinamidine synthase
MVRAAISGGLVESVHDCAEGGVAVAVAECCIAGGHGCEVEWSALNDASSRGLPSILAGILFGETQSRFVVGFREEAAMRLQALAKADEVPLIELGTVGGDRIRFGGVIDVSLSDAAAAHERALLAHG